MTWTFIFVASACYPAAALTGLFAFAAALASMESVGKKSALHSVVGFSLAFVGSFFALFLAMLPSVVAAP